MTETRPMEELILDPKTSEVNSFYQQLEGRINDYNSKLDGLEKKYSFLKLTTKEVKGLFKNDFPQSIQDKIYPDLPPNLRDEHICEVKNQIEDISYIFKGSISNLYLTVEVSRCIDFKKSRLAIAPGTKEYLQKLCQISLHTPERIKTYEKAKQAARFIEEVTNELDAPISQWLQLDHIYKKATVVKRTLNQETPGTF